MNFQSRKFAFTSLGTIYKDFALIGKKKEGASPHHTTPHHTKTLEDGMRYDSKDPRTWSKLFLEAGDSMGMTVDLGSLMMAAQPGG